MSEDKPVGFVICRQGSDPLKPGYVRGHNCAICKKPLQISPNGIVRMTTQKLLTLCNSCGFAMAERLHKAGKTFDMEYTTDFLKSFASYVEGKGVE